MLFCCSQVSAWGSGKQTLQWPSRRRKAKVNSSTHNGRPGVGTCYIIMIFKGEILKLPLARDETLGILKVFFSRLIRWFNVSFKMGNGITPSAIKKAWFRLLYHTLLSACCHCISLEYIYIYLSKTHSILCCN